MVVLEVGDGFEGLVVEGEERRKEWRVERARGRGEERPKEGVGGMEGVSGEGELEGKGEMA